MEYGRMSSVSSHVLIEAEKMDNSIIITFDDGNVAKFSADLLYGMLDQAEPLDNYNDEI